MPESKLSSCTAGDLVRRANDLGSMPSSDPGTDSTDRVAVAIYEVGASIVERLDQIQARLTTIASSSGLRR